MDVLIGSRLRLAAASPVRTELWVNVWLLLIAEHEISRKPLKSLASPAGFEPATHSLEGCCSSPTELRGRSTSQAAHLLRCARPASSTYYFVRLRRPAFARLASEPPAKSHTPCG